MKKIIKKITLGQAIALIDGDKKFDYLLENYLTEKNYSIKTIPYINWIKFVENYYKVEITNIP